MKIISFSLWGQDPKYLTGAIKNADLAKQIYPGWICRFYVGASVPSTVIYDLESRDNVQVVQRPEWGDWRSMYWRFEPAGEEDIDVMISRDCDSRLNLREKAAVDQWIESDKGFHIMRDHPWHQYPVLGGMWGAKKDAVPQIKQMMDAFSSEDAYGTDYIFFAQVVIPSLKPSSVMVHDPFFGGRCFPEKRPAGQFVGKVFDEHEVTVAEHEEMLTNFLANNKNEIYIYHHLGLGDHLDCNGMVRTYVDKYGYDKAHVFAKAKYADLIRFMYRDHSDITVIEIPGNDEVNEVKNFLQQHKIGLFLAVGHHNYPWGHEEKLGLGCAEIFYYLVNMDYKIRFDEFYFTRDHQEEERVSHKLNPDNEEYVFVHDDINRGFSITDEKIYELAGKKIKIIRNDMSENLFNFTKVLEEASQIHCMESCFRSLVETTDVKGDLFFHNFREGASAYLGNSTQQPWKEIEW